MSFESANRLMVKLLTGSTSEVDIICRRFLQKRNLTGELFTNETAHNFFHDWSGFEPKTNAMTFDKELLETNEVQIARNICPGSKIFNRHIIRGVYYDSVAYKRSSGEELASYSSAVEVVNYSVKFNSSLSLILTMMNYTHVLKFLSKKRMSDLWREYFIELKY